MGQVWSYIWGESEQKILTIEDIQAAHPSHRLSLREKANEVSSRKPVSIGPTLEKAGSLIIWNFKTAENNLDLVQGSGHNEVEKNLQKVDIMFQELETQVNGQREFVKSEIVHLTQEQQRDLVAYWQAVNEFFGQLFQWMKTMFQFVLDKIRMGYKVDEMGVKSIFHDVLAQIRQIF